MDLLTAKPNMLKQANLSFIRRVIKSRESATRAEIVRDTMISPTTVRALLSEMMKAGEIKSLGLDESSGGRKAERYTLNPERYYSAAFCVTETNIMALLVDIYGGIIEQTSLEVTDKNQVNVIDAFLDDLIKRREIKSIGIGVPGAVEGYTYWRKDNLGKLYNTDIGGPIVQKYQIPVVLENDLNATAIGFRECYQKEFPAENPDEANMAYLYFEEDCVSAGFIVDGKIIRGASNFAGEISLVPFCGEKPLYECLLNAENNALYIEIVIKVICWICGILNPRYIALGGPAFPNSCIGPISDGLFGFLPNHMMTEVLYAPDMKHDYYNGMAYRAAGKMFDDILFVKE